MFSNTFPDLAGRKTPSMKACLGIFSAAAIAWYFAMPDSWFMAGLPWGTG